MALVIDAVTEVLTLADQDVILAEMLLAHLPYIAGMAKRVDDLILIHDLDRFLSLDEEHALHNAIDGMRPDGVTLNAVWVYVVADVRRLNPPPATVHALQVEGLRSCVQVPLRAQGELIGSVKRISIVLPP